MLTVITLAGRARFPLGQIVSTPGALEACKPDYLAACLARHARGDWGLVCTEDAASNDSALKDGGRILSSYAIDPAKPSKASATIPSGSSPSPTAARPPSFCRTNTEEGIVTP